MVSRMAAARSMRYRAAQARMRGEALPVRQQQRTARNVRGT